MSDNSLRAFYGHHKCASSWLAMICREVCRDLDLRSETVWATHLFAEDLAGFVMQQKLDFLIYTNADFALVSQLEPHRALHMVRDPRDVCISGYFSHRNTHRTDAWPELVEHRARLQRASKEEGLLLDMEFVAPHLEEMRSWPAEAAGVLTLRMEEATADPYGQLLRAFEHLDLLDPRDHEAGRRLGLVASKACRRLESLSGGRIRLPFRLEQLPAERLLGIIWEQDFRKKSGGRTPGAEDLGSHYRKGVPGDWRNHFTDRHVAHFKERYNDLLLLYGYESSSDWDLETSTEGAWTTASGSIGN